MSKLKRSIVAYKDDTSIYASDKSALRAQERSERRKEKNIMKLARAAQRSKRRKERKRQDQIWKARKRVLYNQAHSMSFDDQAHEHLFNTRRHYDDNDVKKYEHKLRNKEYRRLVRLERKFR